MVAISTYKQTSKRTFAPTLTNYPYSAFEPKPPPTSHLTSTLPMTTLTPPMTNAIAPLAFPSRLWVTKCTPSYTVPTHLPSLTLPSVALPALFVEGARRMSSLSPGRRAPLGLPLHPSDPSAPTQSFFFRPARRYDYRRIMIISVGLYRCG